MTTTINTHSLLVQYLPTISPFGIDGNTSTQMPSDSTLLLYSFDSLPKHNTSTQMPSDSTLLLCSFDSAPEAYPFSPFDINVKEENILPLILLQNRLPLSSISTEEIHQIFNKYSP
jgi:hypothetical protein